MGAAGFLEGMFVRAPTNDVSVRWRTFRVRKTWFAGLADRESCGGMT